MMLDLNWRKESFLTLNVSCSSRYEETTICIKTDEQQLKYLNYVIQNKVGRKACPCPYIIDHFRYINIQLGSEA